MDSGCSNHKIGNKNCSVIIDETTKSIFILDDGKRKVLNENALLLWEEKNGQAKYIHDILYILVSA